MSDDSPKPDSKIDQAGSIRYWSSVTPNINGMLGGFPEVSRADLRGSAAFLAKIRRLMPSIGSNGLQLGVDCGAGIGRVTEGFLCKVCETVDIVEPVERFARVVRDGNLKRDGKIGDIYITGLENWTPNKTYDLIWNQWCLGHLTDDQLVDYLVRCRNALSEKGLLVVKENINSTVGEDLYDGLDNSVTRSEEKFRSLFRRAGLTIVRSEEQSGFPKRLQLYPVKSFALRPEL